MKKLMNKCKICNKESKLISKVLSICLNCIRNYPNEALKIAREAHKISREKYELPIEPPKEGIECKLCANKCKIPINSKGFCGLVKNENNSLKRIIEPNKGLLEYYLDPLPTNCVADWVCPGCTGKGYPKYSYCNGPEIGYYNLAIFYCACNLDCLFCQNWFYREELKELNSVVSNEELLKTINQKVSCICFFGGDPAPQMVHALSFANLALENKKGILRVCWETNGLMNKKFLEKAVEISLISGGNIKFDIKAYDKVLYKVLTGVDNKQLFKNIKIAAKRFEEREEVPLVVASTLVIPGYIDEEEIRKIAKFLAKINPKIPYRLLAFYPHYLMNDLPPTSKEHMMKCYYAAKQELENVSIGNYWLLGNYY